MVLFEAAKLHHIELAFWLDFVMMHDQRSKQSKTKHSFRYEANLHIYTQIRYIMSNKLEIYGNKIDNLIKTRSVGVRPPPPTVFQLRRPHAGMVIEKHAVWKRAPNLGIIII
jgi:hypothetical protein